MSRKSLFYYLFGLALFSIATTYVLADWYDPDGPPTGPTTSGPATYNAPTVVNVSNYPQVKIGGGLGINGILTSRNIFSVDEVGIGSVFSTIDPTATLDVDGQIRIRGPFGDANYTPAAGRVLTAFDLGTGATGLARWQNVSAGISFITQGLGIDLIPDPMVAPGDTITASGTIAIDPTYTQRFIAPPCSTYGAIRSVAESGTPTCQDFIPTVMAGSNSGLTLNVNGVPTTAATSGPVTLGVGVGSGVSINGSNQLALVPPGNGLQISSNQLRFANCANNGETWKYNSVTSLWECAPFLPPASAQPGNSVMYIRVKSTANPFPLCPTGSGWVEAPKAVPASNPQWTTNESIGFAPPSPDTEDSPAYNRVRICYNTSRSCQVLELKLKGNGTLNCPTGWTGVTGSEYGPLGVEVNTIRNCYLCN